MKLALTSQVHVKKVYLRGLALLVLMLSGCAAFQTGTEMQAGRLALITGKPQVALTHFNRAAELDPDYHTGFVILREGVWTYVGRASYETENYAAARQALERASARYSNDHLAKLYLGLTLVREGNRQRGLKEMEAGMRGIHDQLEDFTQSFRFSGGRFWDRKREIRSAIQSDLAMLDGKELDVQKLIANGEWLGKRVEEEIDIARRDEGEELFREGAGRQP